MQRPGPPTPLSPLSLSSNDSAFVGRYGGNLSGGGAGTPTDPQFFPGPGPGPYGGRRPSQNASPPSSQHPSSSTDMSRPSASSGSARPPSSSSSMGMSSDGRMGFNKGNSNRDSTRSQFNPEHEDVLSRHYRTLKSYLSSYLAEEKANPKSNRARDKLLRLSVVQFMELSTDVFDELLRREDKRLGRVENVPHFLLPKNSFHPKRNQARQKLSTLPLDRFRQLATDVFYELERRIPRFASGEQSRAPSRGGMRPPPPQGYGGPPPFPPNGPRRGPPNGPYSPGLPPSGSRRPSEAASLGRPLPKQFQSNTIVPNKGTMVEEDDGSEDDDDAFGLSNALTPRSADGNAEDKEKLQVQGVEIAELKEKLESLENRLAEKEEELEKASSTGQDHEEERHQWLSLREELEQKALDAQALNDSLQQELDHLRHSKTQEMDQRIQESEHLRHQLEERQASTSNEDYERRISLLEEELITQEKLTSEVREEATMYLQEMRDLSRQNDHAVEQEELLASKVTTLEREVSDWRTRYAKIKSQNRSLRASTIGLGLQTGFEPGTLTHQSHLLSSGGLIRDVDVTRFQLSVDELLHSARKASTETLLSSVKSVILTVQSMTSSVTGTEDYPTPSPSPPGDPNNPSSPQSVSLLKARVTGTANSLITATKQHAASLGLSPVALLDAAASNLTAAVVELIKAVRIRPSEPHELEHRSLLHRDRTSISSSDVDADDLPLPLHNPLPPSSSSSSHPHHLGVSEGLGSFYNDIPTPSPAGSVVVANPPFSAAAAGAAGGGGAIPHPLAGNPVPSSAQHGYHASNGSSSFSSSGTGGLGQGMDFPMPPVPGNNSKGAGEGAQPLRSASTKSKGEKSGGGWFGWGKKSPKEGERDDEEEGFR